MGIRVCEEDKHYVLDGRRCGISRVSTVLDDGRRAGRGGIKTGRGSAGGPTLRFNFSLPRRFLRFESAPASRPSSANPPCITVYVPVHTSSALATMALTAPSPVLSSCARPLPPSPRVLLAPAFSTRVLFQGTTAPNGPFSFPSFLTSCLDYISSLPSSTAFPSPPPFRRHG